MTMNFSHWTESRIAREPTWFAVAGRLRSRASHRIIATAKQDFPVIAAFAGFAAVLAAIIALRVAIWLPLYFRP